MILLLSGEGPADIGSCDNGAASCSGVNFKAGPMTRLVAQIVDPIWGISVIDIESCEFVTEGFLARESRAMKKPVLPGLKREQETGYFFASARALAKLAKKRERAIGCEYAAVLFRDSDGTCSSPATLWGSKVESIEGGFAAEGFDRGVAMVPKPKSEVWLLCALKDAPYDHCEVLENISGNDNSPNSAKDQLEAALNKHGKEHTDLSDMVEGHQISAGHINMPSFNYFRDRLVFVANAMLGAQPKGA